MTGTKNINIILQERDRHLLRELAIMRVIDRDQAKIIAGFRATRRVNARLLKLTRTKFLSRYFLGTVGGARKGLYTLSEQGAGLVGVPRRGPKRDPDEIRAVDPTAEHQLAVNEIYCILKYQPIPGGGFIRWKAFNEPLTANIPLIPDGYAEIEIQGRPPSMFFEVDLGTESRAIWERKVRGYLALATSGAFSQDFQQAQFRVLAVTTSDRRLESLRVATRKVTEKVFWFTTFESIQQAGFWSAVWLRPSGDKLQALV